MQVRHKHKSVSSAVDLLGALSPREYAHTAYYSGPLSIGSMMNIRVKVGSSGSRSVGAEVGPEQATTDSRSWRYNVHFNRLGVGHLKLA